MKKKNQIGGPVEPVLIPGSKFAARSKFAKSAVAKTKAEERVVESYGVLEVAELAFKPGREFGQAVVDLRNEIKKNGGRNFMTRLEELGIPYAKARYWMAIVEEKPINRGEAKRVPAQPNDSAVGAQEESKPDWRQDWAAATAKFRELADVVIMLAEQQPKGRDSFIGELKNLAEMLGYELRPKGEGRGLLQRVRPNGGGVAA